MLAGLSPHILGRFRRRKPVAVAIRQAVAGLLGGFGVGITLIDAYFATQASQPAGALTRVLLYLSILWLTLPYLLLCLWLGGATMDGGGLSGYFFPWACLTMAPYFSGSFLKSSTQSLQQR